MYWYVVQNNNLAWYNYYTYMYTIGKLVTKSAYNKYTQRAELAGFTEEVSPGDMQS